MNTQVNINYVKTNPDLSNHQKSELDKIIRKHALIAGRILDIPYVTITIYPKSDRTIPETGEGGYAPSGDWLQIFIDLKNKNYNPKFIINNLTPGTVYHEMNHIARWRTVGYGKTLLEAIVTEGLASAFEKDQWKKFTAPWTRSNKAEISNFLKIMKNRDKKKDSEYNHAEWFFGKGKLPRWIGYKLGAHIIESMRGNFPKLSWRQLMAMKASEIIKKSEVKI